MREVDDVCLNKLECMLRPCRRQAAKNSSASTSKAWSLRSSHEEVAPGYEAAVGAHQQIEEAFRNLKGDLAIRPIHHQDAERIEAHIFIAFLAYCLHVTIGLRLKGLAPGLTPRSLFEKFTAVQMIDVHIPTTDGRELRLTRYTQPEPELKLLLERLRLDLPPQPPPKITAIEAAAAQLL